LRLDGSVVQAILASRCGIKIFALCSAAVFFLASPSLGRAQNTGRIDCPRNDGYVYLYSSMVTMEVRATLQCNEVIQLTGRYDNYYGVRNAKGETGYVPIASIVVLKDQPGSRLPAPTSEPLGRERTPYDARPREVHVAGPATGAGFTLRNDTPVHVKLTKIISPATVHAGDVIEFEVVDDVLVEGVPVLTKGAIASGVISEAEPKKRFGRGGRLVFSVKSVSLADGEKATVRCYQEISGSANTSSGASVVPLASGKDAIAPQGTKFTVLVDGVVPLKRESFVAPKDISAAPPETPAQAPRQ
jgi:hypothetical protein